MTCEYNRTFSPVYEYGRIILWTGNSFVNDAKTRNTTFTSLSSERNPVSED